MKKKTDTLTEKDLLSIMKALDRMKEWQYLITFRKVWPFITIKTANIIYIEELKDYREFQIMKELMKKKYPSHREE